MPASRSFSIRDTIQGGRSSFEEYRPLVIRITVLFAALITLAGLLNLTGPAGFALSVGSLLLLGAMYGGLITAMVCLPGNSDEVSELWQAVRPVLAALIWLTLVTAVAIFAGTMALIVPGLIIATIWSVGGQSVVVERLGVFAALKRSAELVRGNGFAVFGYLLLLILITVLLAVLVMLVTLPLGTGIVYDVVFPFLSNLVTAPVYALGLAALYNELTGRGVNPDPEPEQDPVLEPEQDPEPVLEPDQDPKG